MRCSSSLVWCEKDFSALDDNSELIAEETIEENIPVQVSEDEQWLPYSNDILGIKFDYLKTWGEPRIGPDHELTNLEIENSKVSQIKYSTYENTVVIDFPESYTPDILIQNYQYAGERYPNSQALSLGYIDNFDLLTQTGDICDYKYEFDARPRYTGIIKELYTDCSEGVKEVLIEDRVQAVSSVWYNYRLRLVSYHKLQNNIFDRALIMKSFYPGVQTNEPLGSIDEFMEKANFSDEQIEMKNNFKKFANSIQSYKPIETKNILNTISASDSEDIKTIKQYYNYIAENNMSLAYNMQKVKKVSLEKYTEWYENAFKAIVSKVTDKGDSVYEFFVNYRDHNLPEQIFRVNMKIEDGKIDTLSSEEITSDIGVYNDMQVFTKKQSNYNYVILSINGEEIELDKGRDNFDIPGQTRSEVTYAVFSSPKFSPDGKYAYYKETGWEWSRVWVYDISEKKQVADFDVPHLFGFSNNGKYFYACAASDMAGVYYAEVYETNNFEKAYYTPENPEDSFYMSISCNLDSEKEILKIERSCYLENETINCDVKSNFKFDLKTGESLE